MTETGDVSRGVVSAPERTRGDAMARAQWRRRRRVEFKKSPPSRRSSFARELLTREQRKYRSRRRTSPPRDASAGPPSRTSSRRSRVMGAGGDAETPSSTSGTTAARRAVPTFPNAVACEKLSCDEIRRVLIDHTGPHTTASAWCTPILKDFCHHFSPPTPRVQSRHASTPFNSI
jgi:hypothetical protein